MRPLLSITAALICIFLFSAFASVTEDLVAAFKAGNSTAIAKYFGENVDLTMMEEDDLYSSAEAKKKLDNFFKQHPVQDFQLIHEGKSNNGLKYSIGRLSTSNGTFRVSFYIKDENGSTVLRQIMISKE